MQASLLHWNGSSKPVTYMSTALIPPGEERKMAHERLARPDYLACFRPNLAIDTSGGYALLERPAPLRDEDIAACEDRWWPRAGEPIEIPPGMELQRR